MRVLIVEDEAELADVLGKIIRKAGFSVDVFDTKSLAHEAIRSTDYAAVILDRNLPDGDGLHLISELQSVEKAESLPPFLILSAMGDNTEKVEGLIGGAIDYVVKPYDPEELIARLKICIATKSGISGHEIKFANIVYDTINKTLKVKGEVLTLRRRELAIFDILIRNRNSVVHHERVENFVYGVDQPVSSNALIVHVSRLRKSLDAVEADVSVKVMRNIGYILRSKK